MRASNPSSVADPISCTRDVDLIVVGPSAHFGHRGSLMSSSEEELNHVAPLPVRITPPAMIMRDLL